MDRRVSYYNVLQVSPHASDAEVRDAYRKLAMRFHPDRNPGRPDAELRIRLINEAYTALRTLDQRQRYNALLRKRIRPSVANDNRGASPFRNIGSLIKEIFWPIADPNDTSQRVK